MARAADVRERLTALCATLPQAGASLEAGRHLRLAVRGRTFAWLVDDHHGDGRVGLCLKVPPGQNSALVEAEPDTYYLPAYLASKGWVGAYLDAGEPDWDRLEPLLVASYRLVAPRRLVARL